jgi:predicted nucleotidyltransferase
LTLGAFTESGDLPVGVHRASLGVHRASLSEVIERFGSGSVRRGHLSQRLERIYGLAMKTGQLRRFIIFGSFVTDKTEPNDIDIFMLMDDGFDVSQVAGESHLLFDHAHAQAHFGASVFWLRRVAALDSEENAIADWQIKRDGNRRGIVEIIPERL